MVLIYHSGVETRPATGRHCCGLFVFLGFALRHVLPWRLGGGMGEGEEMSPGKGKNEVEDTNKRRNARGENARYLYLAGAGASVTTRGALRRHLHGSEAVDI